MKKRGRGETEDVATLLCGRGVMVGEEGKGGRRRKSRWGVGRECGRSSWGARLSTLGTDRLRGRGRGWGGRGDGWMVRWVVWFLRPRDLLCCVCCVRALRLLAPWWPAEALCTASENTKRVGFAFSFRSLARIIKSSERSGASGREVR